MQLLNDTLVVKGIRNQSRTTIHQGQSSQKCPQSIIINDHSPNRHRVTWHMDNSNRSTLLKDTNNSSRNNGRLCYLTWHPRHTLDQLLPTENQMTTFSK